MGHYVTAKDMDLFFCGKALKLRGFGIGTWLNMEHFMLGIPTPDSMIRDAFATAYGKENAGIFFDKLRDDYVTEDDFIYLKSCGVNFIRVPFNYRLMIDDQTGQYREDGFRALTKLMDFCEQYQIFCMPDLHTVPGGQNPDWHSDNRTGQPQFWEFAAFQNQIVALWGEIAKRLRGYTYLLGYDLLNEPAMANWDVLNSFYAKTIAEIRKHDPHHAIVLEGDMFAMDFSGLSHFDDHNMVLSFHYYPTVWHPELLDKNLSRNARYAQLESGLAKLAKIRETFGLPVICGEAGYDLDAGNMDFCMNLLEDNLDIFEKYRVSWAIWAYKDACFMGIVHPKQASPWMKFTDEISRQWGHYREMEQAKQITSFMAEHFGGISDELAYQAQFCVRGILYKIQQEKILLPLLRKTNWQEVIKLPESFLFSNCETHKEYFDLICKYTKNR